MPGVGLNNRPRDPSTRSQRWPLSSPSVPWANWMPYKVLTGGPEVWPGEGQSQLSVCVLLLSMQPGAPQASGLEASPLSHELQGEVLCLSRMTELLSGQLRPRLYLWLDLVCLLCVDPEDRFTTRAQRRSSRDGSSQQLRTFI